MLYPIELLGQIDCRVYCCGAKDGVHVNGQP